MINEIKIYIYVHAFIHKEILPSEISNVPKRFTDVKKYKISCVNVNLKLCSFLKFKT
jgi:hypothetical protein